MDFEIPYDFNKGRGGATATSRSQALSETQGDGYILGANIQDAGIQTGRNRQTQDSRRKEYMKVDSSTANMDRSPPLNTAHRADFDGTVTITHRRNSSAMSVFIRPFRQDDRMADFLDWNQTKGTAELRNTDLTLADAFVEEGDLATKRISAQDFAREFKDRPSDNGLTSPQSIFKRLTRKSLHLYQIITDKSQDLIKSYDEGFPLFIRPSLFNSLIPITEIYKLDAPQPREAQNEARREYFLRQVSTHPSQSTPGSRRSWFSAGDKVLQSLIPKAQQNADDIHYRNVIPPWQTERMSPPYTRYSECGVDPSLIALPESTRVSSLQPTVDAAYGRHHDDRQRPSVPPQAEQLTGIVPVPTLREDSVHSNGEWPDHFTLTRDAHDSVLELLSGHERMPFRSTEHRASSIHFHTLKHEQHQSFVRFSLDDLQGRIGFLTQHPSMLRRDTIDDLQGKFYKQCIDFMVSGQNAAAQQCMHCLTLTQICKAHKPKKWRRLLSPLTRQRSPERAAFDKMIETLTNEMRSAAFNPPEGSVHSFGAQGNFSERFPITESDDGRAIDPLKSSNPDVRKLGAQYKTRHGQHFFRRGRVFQLLWHEPVGESHNKTTDSFHDTASGRSRYSQGPYGQAIYNHIRQMIVIRNRDKHCWCVSMGTYGGHGLQRNKFTDAEIAAHAVIYNVDSEPITFPHEPSMVKIPIAVRLSSGKRSIHSATRVHFGKPYNIEWNLKVMNIGQVIENHIPYLVSYARMELLGE